MKGTALTPRPAGEGGRAGWGVRGTGPREREDRAGCGVRGTGPQEREGRAGWGVRGTGPREREDRAGWGVRGPVLPGLPLVHVLEQTIWRMCGCKNSLFRRDSRG